MIQVMATIQNTFPVCMQKVLGIQSPTNQQTKPQATLSSKTSISIKGM